MNIAITGGLQLMPSGFGAGLEGWSRGNGPAGDPTWAGMGNATIIAADQDFGRCLAITKTEALTKLRWRGETPIFKGVYLRISARIKLVAGAPCEARIGAWALDDARNHVGGLVETGPAILLDKVGEIREISAIVGVADRPGVTMPWGVSATRGHFGLDLTGANGGTVRIESIRIEDETAAFVPNLLDWVDVRDYGARGDGVTDDRAAFLAADAAAGGGNIHVPAGTYRIGSSMSINHPIRFTGRLTAPDSARIAFMQSFDFPTYADAFGDETIGLRKALQALFGYTDHVTLDLRGRRVDLSAPLLMHEIAPGLASFSNRRVIANGQIMAVDNGNWNTATAQSNATYNPQFPLVLSGVANVAQIEVGSLVSGQGVGREVYVAARDVANQRLTLSQPLWGGAGTRNLTFRRFRYLFDFSGMAQLDRLNFADVEFLCEGRASGIMLAPQGQMIAMRDCYMVRPRDRGITSIGQGCQDMLIDRCQFLSNEADLPAQERSTIAINVNANDTKIRDNRFVRFAHFMVANGTGHIISGNHWFQGDDGGAGLRFAGLVLTRTNAQTTVTGNYIDNAWVEWTNEHTAYPAFSGAQYSFGGLSITGNTCLCSNTTAGFSWLVVKPFGPGHFIHGLTVTGNVFKASNGDVDRIERVDDSHAGLDYLNMRNIQFEGNTFNAVNTYTANPLMVQITQNTAAAAWTSEVLTGLPFGGWCKSCEALVAETAITNNSGARVSEMPWAEFFAGTSKRQMRLNWSQAAKGRVMVMARVDRAL